MQVKDYEIIQNINVLFQKPVIIYGFGTIGKKIYALLQKLPVQIAFLCDKENSNNKKDSILMISFEELIEETEKREYLIIIGSQIYCAEMMENIENNNVKGDICTWYGIQTAIELNVGSLFVEDKETNNIIRRKRMLRDSFYGKYLFQIIYDLSRTYNPILIYQPGKVGSTTIERTLKEVNIPCVHFHWLESNIPCERGFNKEIFNLYNEYSTLLHEKLIEEELRIITLVREPIAKELSEFMQLFMVDYVEDIVKTNNLEEEVKAFVIKRILENQEFLWFDKELKALTNIDIFQYPFDKENGYLWIKEGKVQILVLKTEMLDENESIIGEFVGKSNLKIVRDNIGNEKHYKYIYQELKQQFRLPKKIVEELYVNNRYLDHFYTLEEKKAFYEKWRGNLE